MGTLRLLLAAALAASACGGPAAPAPRPAPVAQPSPAAPEAPEPEPAREPPDERPVVTARPDLLRCALTSTVHELGDLGDGAPSAPAIAGASIYVAFARAGDPDSVLYVQRLTADGTLEAPRAVASGVHYSRPTLVGDGASVHVVAVRADGASQAIPLDEDREPPTAMPHPMDDVAHGPRGFVGSYVEPRGRVVWRPSQADVVLPRQTSFGEPREQLVASGRDADVVLLRHGHAIQLAAIAGSSATRSHVLFQDRQGTWAEASVAAGPDGFALVRTGPEIGDLEVFLADAAGTIGGPAVAIPPPASSTRPPDALVRRYPRVAAVRDGWALSYWDGTGPSLVRVDRHGAVTADAIELRSGDERGGHTDARMAASDALIAVTWQVEPPRFGHGFESEEPRRPGPRLAVLRCAP